MKNITIILSLFVAVLTTNVFANDKTVTLINASKPGGEVHQRTQIYKEGLEKTSDLLMAETQYAQKQLEYYQTIYEYNYAKAYLQFLTKE